MASFLNLPNELLIEIWRHVLHPEDIESFALTSKGILALAEPFLEDHRTLKEKFSTCYTWRPAGKVSAAGLLKEITMNSRVALYVKRLVINVWRDSWEPPARQIKFINTHFILSEELNDGGIYFHKPYAETDMQIFEQVVKRNEYAFGDNMSEVLLKGISDTVTFFELIKGFKGLKHFSYDSDSDHKMFAIRNALVANARYSLETLILRPLIPVRKSIGSFRGFKALKKLEIDHMHLADFDPRRGIYSVDVLPSSLEELHLHYYHRKGFNDHSVRMDPLRIGPKLLEERDRHVPNLKLVALYDDYYNYPYDLEPDLDAAAPGIAELQATFIANGLRLEILDSQVLTPNGIPSRHFVYFGNWLLHAPF